MLAMHCSHSILYTTFLANNGSDYSGLPVVISFSAGHPLNTPFCASFTIIDDDTLENTEIFSVALYTDISEGVFLTIDRSTVEIIDNEEGIELKNRGRSYSNATILISWMVQVTGITFIPYYHCPCRIHNWILSATLYIQ